MIVRMLSVRCFQFLQYDRARAWLTDLILSWTLPQKVFESYSGLPTEEAEVFDGLYETTPRTSCTVMNLSKELFETMDEVWFNVSHAHCTTIYCQISSRNKL